MIQSLNYSLFPSDEFFTFSQGVYSLANGKLDKLSVLQPYVTKVGNRLSDLQEALMRDKSNPNTPLLTAANTQLDASFMSFKTYIEAAGYRKTEGWHNASKTLETVIRKFNWRANSLGYKAEIAAMSNMVKEIKDKYLAQVAVVKGENWFADFESDLKVLTDLHTKSNENTPNVPTIRETRPKLTQSLRNLFSFIALTDENNPSDDLTVLINALNELITRSLASIKAADARDENNKNKNGDNPTGEDL